MKDWVELAQQSDKDPDLLDVIQRICAVKIHDEYEQRYHFWDQYVRQQKNAPGLGDGFSGSKPTSVRP